MSAVRRCATFVVVSALAFAFSLILAVSAVGSPGDTPYMGVDTWYAFYAGIDEQRVVDFTNEAANDGLERAGYRIIWLDAGWWPTTVRDAQGNISVEPSQWPHGMAWLARYIHSKGFLAGIYEESGDTACYNGGAYGHVQQDVNTFAAWGFDALKVDYCGDLPRLHRLPATVYGEFARAIANDTPHRPIMLNAANADNWDRGAYNDHEAWRWGPEVGAASWRTDADLSWPDGVSWGHVLRNIDADAAHPEVAGHGHWNDPDYLIPTLLPPTEARTQFSMWAMLAAPMMVSADLSTVPTSTIAMLTNRRVLAISQDPLGIQARAVADRGHIEVWVKRLVDHSLAVACLNRGTSAAKITLRPRDLGLRSKRLSVLHVWTGAKFRVHKIRLTVAGTATALLRVRPSR